MIVGALFAWFGYEGVASENPDFIGWVLLVIGIITILSAFSSSKHSGSGSDGGGISEPIQTAEVRIPSSTVVSDAMLFDPIS